MNKNAHKNSNFHKIGAVSSLSGVPTPTLRVWELRYENFQPLITKSKHRLWQIENLIGIDPKNQVKRRMNSERQGFKFDYIGFWTELGASKNFSGYWNLANETPIRNLRDVPSHKRSQYKKRNALVEQMNLNVRLQMV